MTTPDPVASGRESAPPLLVAAKAAASLDLVLEWTVVNVLGWEEE